MSGKPGWQFFSNTRRFKGKPPTYPTVEEIPMTTPPPPQEAAESSTGEEKCDILADAMKLTELDVNEAPKTPEKSPKAEDAVVKEEGGVIDVSASLLRREKGHFMKRYKKKCKADELLSKR